MIGFSFVAVLALRKYTLKRAVVRSGKKAPENDAKDGKEEKKDEMDIEAQTVRGQDEDEKKIDNDEETTMARGDNPTKTDEPHADTNENITMHERRDVDGRV